MKSGSGSARAARSGRAGQDILHRDVRSSDGRIEPPKEHLELRRCGVSQSTFDVLDDGGHLPGSYGAGRAFQGVGGVAARAQIAVPYDDGVLLAKLIAEEADDLARELAVTPGLLIEVSLINIHSIFGRGSLSESLTHNTLIVHADVAHRLGHHAALSPLHQHSSQPLR
ncbi:hypothetical protein CHELA1G11_11444 [Hyphomicrobiales bacterium]|nr:hypothetical protein CHELA1G11_11444 [Hyphomicrobiales bacterium]CAH1667716.1 hypothetical protein CHELA1G2_12864 [Hyphomicrobiales bacterium]